MENDDIFAKIKFLLFSKVPPSKISFRPLWSDILPASNIGGLYERYSKFKPLSEDILHFKIWFYFVVDHRIVFKLQSSKMENGN